MPAVGFEVATDDTNLIARLAGPHGPVPGAMQQVPSGALLVYEGLAERTPDGTPAHAFTLEFGTPNVAATAANWLWSQFQGHAVSVRVAGTEVPLHHAALKDALLGAAGIPQPV